MTSRYEKVDKAFIFLTEKGKNSQSFSIDDLAKSVGWKDKNSIRSKKLDLILLKEGNLYTVKPSFFELTPQDFRDLCSQKNNKVETITRKLKNLNKTISEKLLDKATAACMSAIEIYNKPNFDYREEVFAILMINAWELLLKAKILKNHADKIETIYKRNKKGDIVYKKDTQIPITKSISDCIKEIQDPYCEINLKSLIQIRDNSTHFINEYPNLRIDLHKLTTSCLDNFFIASKKWFEKKYDEYNFYVLPLSCNSISSENPPTVLDKSTKELYDYLKNNKDVVEQLGESEFSYAINLNFSKEKASLTFNLTNDENAQQVRLSSENIRNIYKWDFQFLIKELKERYLDFTPNQYFHNLKKEIQTNSKYCYENLLDPTNPKSPKKIFYNPESIFKYFDQYYQRKKT